VYHVLIVYYNGGITLGITGVQMVIQGNPVLVVVIKKNFTSNSYLSRTFEHEILVFSCADISIASKDNDLLLPLITTATTTQGPLFLFPFIDPGVFPSEIEHLPIFTHPTTTTTEPTTTTAMVNFVLPFASSEEIINQLNKNNKTLRCYPTNEVLKPLIGIENWCLQLCAVHCPPTLCACVNI
jgi:hypothetical protein